MKKIIRLAFLTIVLWTIWEVAKEIAKIDRSPEGVARKARDKARMQMGYVQHGP